MSNLKKILWINEKADFTGGCESYIFHTASHLKNHGFKNILLYDVEGWTEPSFTKCFEEAYPNVSLKRQIMEIKPDLIYVHRISGLSDIYDLIECNIPVVRFYHDHKLFCLREHKYKTLSLKTCTKPTGFRCYPCLGFINKKQNFPYIKFSSLTKLHKEQNLNKKLQGFVVASEYMKDHLIMHNFAADKILVNPLFSWQTPQENSLTQNKGYFLLAGQLLRGKGVDLALNAMKQLPPQAKLYIAGSGKQENEFKELSTKLNLNDRVKFHGFLKKDDLKELYKDCFCLLFPSRVPETFGLSGLEAMSFAKPVIASNVGGIGQWLIDGKNGISFDINNEKSLAEAMLKLWNNPQLAQTMGKNGYDLFLAEFQPKNHVDKLALYFNQLISGGNHVK